MTSHVRSALSTLLINECSLINNFNSFWFAWHSGGMHERHVHRVHSLSKGKEMSNPIWGNAFPQLLGGYSIPRTTDTQWRHKSKKYENLGRFGRQNILSAVPKNLGCRSGFSTMQWRQFPHRASIVCALSHWINVLEKSWACSIVRKSK